MRPRLGLPLSLALHGALLFLMLALTVESSPTVLFVDLLHGWQSGSPAAPSGPAAGSDGAPPRRARAARPSRLQRGAGAPSLPSATPAPSEAPAAAAVAIAPAPAPPAPAPAEAGTVASSRVPAASAAARVDIVEAPAVAAGGGRVAGGSGTGGGNGDRAGGGADGGRPGGGGVAGGRGGSALAALGSGGGAGGGGLEYEGYYRLIRRRVQEALEYPLAARRRGLTGTVVVEIEVDAGGAIKRVALVDSSSHALLDDAVLEAARGLGRTPFPPGLRPRPLRMHLPIVFRQE